MDTPPPGAALMQLTTAFWVPQALYVVARLNVADHLAAGPRDAGALAAAVGADPGALRRVLRTLSAHGVFAEVEPGVFALGPVGATLRTGAPEAGRATVLSLVGPTMWQSAGALLHSVQTGRPAFEHVHGAPVFDWFGRHPEEGALFNDAMIGVHGAEPAAVAAAYDFSGLGTIVDVGGGTGNLLAAVLGAAPGARGVLFDLPHVAAAARERLGRLGLADRVEVAEGSFFEDVPQGGDAYLLSHVIHDWDDARSGQILANVRAAMRPGARLLLVEMVVPPGDAPHPAKILDLVMLAVPGGQERTADEYRALLSASGLRLTRVVPTASPVSVVEAVAG
ncbi:MAG: methyltransferase [Planctomycetes bacterium]|nr:methyltransferase [Planctomycetota bacterium]